MLSIMHSFNCIDDALRSWIIHSNYDEAYLMLTWVNVTVFLQNYQEHSHSFWRKWSNSAQTHRWSLLSKLTRWAHPMVNVEVWCIIIFTVGSLHRQSNEVFHFPSPESITCVSKAVQSQVGLTLELKRYQPNDYNNNKNVLESIQSGVKSF